MENTPPIRRAVGYIRRSRPGAGGADLSHEVQEHAVRERAAREGFPDLEVLSDWHVSGTDKGLSRRTSYAELKRRIDSGELDDGLLVSYSMSRLARSTVELLGLFRLAEAHRVHIAFARDADVDYTTPGGKVQAGMIAVLAAFEADVASERSRDAIAARRRKGEKLGEPYFETKRPEDLDAVLSAVQETGTYLGAARLLNEHNVAPYKGELWHGKVVRDIVKRVRPELRQVGLRPRNRTDAEFLFSKFVRCPCGVYMTARSRASSDARARARRRVGVPPSAVTYVCYRGNLVKDHPRPYHIRQEVLGQFAISEARRFYTPGETPGTESREDLVAARDRLGQRYEWGHVEEADYLAEYDDLTARIKAVEHPPDLPFGQGTFASWVPKHPREWEKRADRARRLFRALWKEFKVEVRDGELVPVRAVWHHPERRWAGRGLPPAAAPTGARPKA